MKQDPLPQEQYDQKAEFFRTQGKIEQTIQLYKEFGKSVDETINYLIINFGLTAEEAEIKVKEYLNTESGKIFTFADIQQIVKPLAEKYHISEVCIFGSYARNEATSASDIDFLVFGGKDFEPTSVFAFAEELRIITQKQIDCFEIHEVNPNSPFYNTIMKEKVKVFSC